MATFGDSFVFGDGVRNNQTWQHFLEQSIENFEVLNFGVSGYGLGQSYLRYLKEGLRFNPDIVFFNYIALGDREQFSALCMTRPEHFKLSTPYCVLFRIEDGILKMRSISPLDLFDEDFRKEYVYEPLEIKEDQFLLTSRIFKISNVGLLIKKALLKRQILGSFKMDKVFPSEDIKLLSNLLNVVRRNQSTIIFFCPQEFRKLPLDIQLLLKKYRERVVYVNSTKLLQMRFDSSAVSKEGLWNQSGHYSPKGNLLYAEAVASILRNRIWGEGGRKFEFDEVINSFKRHN